MLSLLLESGGIRSPLALSGARAWWDASDTGTITQAGGVASAFADKSGMGATLSQATGAKQPAVTAAALNGRTALTFDGSNDTMLTAGAINTGATAMTFWGVFKSTKTASGIRIIADTASGNVASNGGSTITHDDRGGNNGTNSLAGSVSTGTSGGASDFTYFGKDGGYTDASWIFFLIAYSANSRLMMYGSLDQAPYSIYQSSVGTAAFVASALPFALGADNTGAAPSALVWGEGGVYGRRLSFGEGIKLYRYAHRRWAI